MTPVWYAVSDTIERRRSPVIVDAEYRVEIGNAWPCVVWNLVLLGVIVYLLLNIGRPWVLWLTAFFAFRYPGRSR